MSMIAAPPNTKQQSTAVAAIDPADMRKDCVVSLGMGEAVAVDVTVELGVDKVDADNASVVSVLGELVVVALAVIVEVSESVVVDMGDSVVADALSVVAREEVMLLDETTSLVSSVDLGSGISLVRDKLSAWGRSLAMESMEVTGPFGRRR